MTTSWKKVNVQKPNRIVEQSSPGPDPLKVYTIRYTQDWPGGDFIRTQERTEKEVFDYFEEGSSVLLFGSGHSYWANNALSHPNIDKVVVVDYVKEAGLGLSEQIDFYCCDIADYSGPPCDYVYSSHTVEHFPRQAVLETVLPKCLQFSNKAVVFLVPYGEAWSDEPSHHCLFYEDDELAFQASKYKIIRDGVELVLWFDSE